MKKINRISQLEVQKNHVGRRREELEKRIRKDWKELKKDLGPGSLKNSFEKGLLQSGKELNGKPALQKALIYGTIPFARCVAGKAISRSLHFFKKR